MVRTNNVVFAYDNLNAKFDVTPVYDKELTYQMAKMTQKDNESFAMLVAIADNMRKISGLLPLSIRDVTELAKIFNEKYPIITPLNPNDPSQWYIYQRNHTDIQAQFAKDKYYFDLKGSNMYLGCYDNDIALAGSATRGEFDLSTGAYEPQRIPQTDKQTTKTANRFRDICDKIGGWFGRTDSVEQPYKDAPSRIDIGDDAR